MLHRNCSILAFTFALVPCAALLAGCPEEKKPDAVDAEATPAPKVTAPTATTTTTATASTTTTTAPAADAGAPEAKDAGHETAKPDAGKAAKK